MIKVVGPNWSNTRALRAALANVTENGTFQFGISHCNKLEQLQHMAEADVRCVPFTKDFDEVYENVTRYRQIWLGRKLNHTQGKDILLPDRKFWRIRDYWTRYIPSVEEWRIHIFDGQSIARGLKLFLHHQPNDPTAVIIRNRARDYLMRHDVDPPDGMRQLAKYAVAAVGESFGAVDILVGQNGLQYVLEVNTAPAMDNYTRSKYVKAIRRRFV